jgi:hypothetical protein
MTAGIKSRIGKHGYPIKGDPVKDGRSGFIAAAAPLPGIPFLILMKNRAMLVGIRYRSNCLVGTYRRTHSATNTFFFHTGMLTNADKMAKLIAPFLTENIKFGNPLSPVGEIYGVNRADRGTLPAQGATVFTVLYNPRQIAVG